jgi:hypothetical protein
LVQPAAPVTARPTKRAIMGRKRGTLMIGFPS